MAGVLVPGQVAWGALQTQSHVQVTCTAEPVTTPSGKFIWQALASDLDVPCVMFDREGKMSHSSPCCPWGVHSREGCRLELKGRRLSHILLLWASRVHCAYLYSGLYLVTAGGHLSVCETVPLISMHAP